MSARLRLICIAALTLASLASPLAAAEAPSAHEAALRDLIQSTVAGKADLGAMTPELAEAVRPQLATATAELQALGELKSVALKRVDASGMEFYRTSFERGELEWAFRVNAAGKIDNAAFRPAK